ETLMDILVQMKRSVPEFVRIERLFRDIPGESILEGSQKTNMRQLLQDKMKKENVSCRCIRCREIKDLNYDPAETVLKIEEFDASEGKEFFLSFNDTKRDLLCSLLRLRFSSYSLKGKKHFIPELENAALIREVHTYGAQVKIGKNSSSESQHVGLGRQLIEEAEKLAKRGGYKKMAIIAGIGTRNYYRKWGYELEGTYMTKYI
ncbi:MAG: tRNA uridine(34) 5-carboxymethylaminomethyl modification radical SAM/GNAT enzyme Elp3, partial [Patescibacteria group bacterium]